MKEGIERSWLFDDSYEKWKLLMMFWLFSVSLKFFKGAI